jgi:hypothetical protein
MDVWTIDDGIYDDGMPSGDAKREDPVAVAVIAQLTAENERLTRVVEQAILVAGLEVTGDYVSSNRYGIHFSPPVPDLFAQLKGGTKDE